MRFEDLEVAPIINASGSVTRLGGAPMPANVLNAFQDAAASWAPLDQLQAAASEVIARWTDAESGIVTAGSAAGLTLGAAAILAKLDLSKMEQLPQCDGFPHEFVIAREHRNGYDHAVRAAGAKLVDVGFNEIVSGAGVRRTEAWEYEVAFHEATAGVLYVLTPNSQPPLKQVVEIAHQHGIPVLVDAAGELPPRSNLRLCETTGADLVAFSGGKAIRGPQSTGILCGKKELIASAMLQMLDMDDHFALWEAPPELFDKKNFTRDHLPGIPRHGVGRGLKVSKEEIMALLTALESFARGEYLAELPVYRRWLETLVEKLSDTDYTCNMPTPANEESPPILELAVPEKDEQTALEICRRLRQGSPPIYVGHGRLHEAILVVHPMCLTEKSIDVLADGLRLACSR